MACVSAGEVSFDHDEQFTNETNFGSLSFNGSMAGNGFGDFRSNVLNTVNLGVPGTNVSSPSSFGIIRSAQPMRQLQLGMRLPF